MFRGPQGPSTFPLDDVILLGGTIHAPHFRAHSDFLLNCSPVVGFATTSHRFTGPSQGFLGWAAKGFSIHLICLFILTFQSGR